MPGHLFTEYFLTDGIRQTPERQSQRAAFAAFRDRARCLLLVLDAEDCRMQSSEPSANNTNTEPINVA